MEELDVSDLLTVAQAMAVIDAAPLPAAGPGVERVPLAEAQGRRLAQDLTADRDAPPFDKSQMDGYAVRCADVAGAPVELRVVGEIAAGKAAERGLESGEAMAIMTGAPMPRGADGVVPVEETAEHSADQTVRIMKGTAPGRYIAPRGSDARAGQVLLRGGAALDAAQLAVAASVGVAEVMVYAKPRVAVLSTGDELVPVSEQPGANQIRNSNNVMLMALLRGLGCAVRDLGTAPDDPQAIRTAMEGALAEHEVLFVTGGMSMGTHDYVPPVISDLKFEIRISKLRIKPGKPFVFAVSAASDSTGPRYIFGLPGNPVSGFVSTVRLASRLLARLGGGQPREKWLAGKTDVGLPANGPREFYQPVVWSPVQGGTSARSEFATVTPLAWKGSADIFTLAAANALLVRPENEPPLGKGTLVRVLEI
jgi:molybdopterin molybdotransferase